MRKLRFPAAALVAFALLSALLVKPAGALDGHAVAIKHGVNGSGRASVVLVLNPQQQLTQFSCQAVATVVASNGQPYAATSVDSCRLYVSGLDAPFEAESATAPGDVATTKPMPVATPLHAVLTVCWEVTARPTFGPTDYDDGCTTVNTALLAA